MADGPTVSGHSTWACRGDEKLPAVLLPVHLGQDEHLTDIESDATHGGSRLVVLEQEEEGSPCVVTVCSASHDPPSLIGSLLVTSEARTIEVYSLSGDYCGTSRGQREDAVQMDGAEGRGPFYKTHLILESPCISCEVKLLSLGGRSRVAVSRILVGLQPQGPSPLTDRSPTPGLGPSIDMQRVQTLVEEMGSSLSPGAQSLMEMVNVQQKNQASALGGLLPLLLGGGAFSALGRGSAGPLVSARNGPFLPTSTPPANSSSASPTLSSQISTPGSNAAPSASAGLSAGRKDTTNAQKAIDCAQLAEMMSHFLNSQAPGPGGGGALDMGSTPAHFLPMLQSVCGQVTQLRLDDAAAATARSTVATWELDEAMERRLDDMERRLKEHVDRRLDALELKLEQALLAAAMGPRAAAVASGGPCGAAEEHNVPSLEAPRTAAP